MNDTASDDTADQSALVDNSFADELCTYIAQQIVRDSTATVAPDTDLLLSGLVDSLGVVLIVEWIEQRLGTVIDAGDVVIEHFQTPDAIVAYLRDASPNPSLDP